jgi:hypothetical protein
MYVHHRRTIGLAMNFLRISAVVFFNLIAGSGENYAELVGEIFGKKR